MSDIKLFRVESSKIREVTSDALQVEKSLQSRSPVEAARSTKAFVEVTDKGFDTKGITPLARLNVEPRGFGGEGGRGSNNRGGEQSGRNNGDDRPASERWGHTGGGYAVKREGTGPHVGSLPPAGEKRQNEHHGHRHDGAFFKRL